MAIEAGVEEVCLDGVQLFLTTLLGCPMPHPHLKGAGSRRWDQAQTDLVRAYSPHTGRSFKAT